MSPCLLLLLRSEVGLFRNVMAVGEEDSDSAKKKPARQRRAAVDSDEEGSQRMRYRRTDPAKDPYFRGYVSRHQERMLSSCSSRQQANSVQHVCSQTQADCPCRKEPCPQAPTMTTMAPST